MLCCSVKDRIAMGTNNQDRWASSESFSFYLYYTGIVHVVVVRVFAIILHRHRPRMDQVCRGGGMVCLYVYVCASVPGVRARGWMYIGW